MSDQSNQSNQNDRLEERLSSFDSGVPVSPLSAAQVRRKGDRLRRRNIALTTVAAAAVVAVVTTPAVVLAGHDRDHSAPAGPASQGTGGTSAPALPSARDSVLTASDLPVIPNDQDNTYTAWEAGGFDFSVLGCHAGPLPDLGAQDQAEIKFGSYVNADQVGTDGPPGARAADAVFDFGSDGEANQAYDEAHGWLDACDQVGEGRKLMTWGESSTDVPVDVGEGLLVSHTVADDDICDWQDGCDGAFREFQGVARFGTRLVLFSWVETTGNLTDEDAIAQRASTAFDAAIDRAQGLTTAPADPGDGDDTGDDQGDQGGDGGATELSYAPLDRGMKVDGDSQKDGPSSDAPGVVFPDGWCSTAPDADALERLAVTVTGPEYGHSRLAVNLGTPEAAQERLKAFVDAVYACPRVTGEGDGNGLTFQTFGSDGTTGVAFGYTYDQGTGGALYAVAPLGPYLIMVEYDGEYLPDSLEDSVPQIRRELSNMITLVGQVVCGPDAVNCQD